jgi:selenocysteine-specific elongation factor
MSAASVIDPSLPPDEIASTLLSIRESESLTRLSAESRGGRPATGVMVGDEALTDGLFGALTARASNLVRDEHSAHPLRPGMPMATLAERLRVSPAVAEEVVNRWSELTRIGPDVASADHEVALTDSQEDGWHRARERLAAGLSVPVESELDLDADIVAMKVRSGDLVRISADILYLPEQVESISSILGSMDDGFTVADFRDRSGLTRKYAVPILEWSDKEGLTVRRGDVRRIR